MIFPNAAAPSACTWDTTHIPTTKYTYEENPTDDSCIIFLTTTMPCACTWDTAHTSRKIYTYDKKLAKESYMIWGGFC